MRKLAGLYEENAYICWVEGSSSALIVDPGDGASMLLEQLRQRELTLTHILITHGHFDHIMAVSELLEKTNAKVWVHERDEGMLFDPYPLKLPMDIRARFEPVRLPQERKVAGRCLLFPGEDGMRIEMIETPGHTPGGVCFYLPDERTMFTGDTLFSDGYGRTDFATSRVADMRASLIKLFAMDEGIMIHPGHGEEDTIGAVKRRFRI